MLHDYDLDPLGVSYEPDDNAPKNIPTDPVELSFGNDDPLNRYLGFQDPPDPVDDDWLVFELSPQ